MSKTIIAKANKASIANNIKPSGTGNYTTTGSPNIALGYGAIGTVGPVGNPGQAGNREPEFITILGRKFELDSYLTDTTKFHLAQVDFHGILFYKSLRNMNINFYIKEVSEYLDTLLKMEERNTQLENILEQIN